MSDTTSYSSGCPRGAVRHQVTAMPDGAITSSSISVTGKSFPVEA